MRRTGLLLAAAVGVATLGLAAPAGAAVPTTTSLTGLSSGPFLLVTGADQTFTVSGTSNGTSGTLDLVCFAGNNSFTVVADSIPVGAGGAWSASVSTATMSNVACTLRAVPTPATQYDYPTDVSAFHGRVVGVSHFAMSDDGGASVPYGFYVAAEQERSLFTLGDAVGCPVGAVYPRNPAGDAGYQELWKCVGALGGSTSFTEGPQHRAALLVDGVPAQLPRTLHYASNTYTPVTASATIDPTDGDLTVVESEVPSRCDQPDVVPPTSDSCSHPVALGVRLDRVLTTSAQGGQTTVRSTWVSTDGKAHAIDEVTSVVAFQSQDKEGFSLPWISTDVTQHHVSQRFAGPGPGPTTITSIDSTTEPVSDENPTGTVTTSQAPIDAAFSSAGYLSLHLAHAVPAGGSTISTMAVTAAPDSAAVAALAAASRTAFVPTLTVNPVAPLVATKALVLSGTVAAGGNGLPATVTVAGQGAAPVKADGSWSLPVTLAPGANALQVSTSDDGGNVVTRTVAVSLGTPVVVGSPAQVSTISRKKVLTKVQVTVPLTCAAFAASCPSTVVLKDGTKVLGTRKVTVVGSSTATFTLSSAELKLVKKLKKGKTRKVTVAVTTADPAGGSFASPVVTLPLSR